MSEHITHTAICDDVRRLCLHLDDIPHFFKQAWSDHTDISRLGSVTRHADRWSADLVTYVRDHPGDADSARKMAFVLGALTHRSIDRHMKPVFTYFKQSIDARIIQGSVVNECTIYCDMLILKEVFSIDHLFSESLFDKSLSEKREAFHELMRTTWQRVLIQMHTLKPDDDHVHEWLSRLFKGIQDFSIRMQLYEEIAANPDPEKWHRYLVETRFYDPSDSLIHLARRIHRGQTVSTQDVEKAVGTTTQEASLYARAIQRAIDYIRTAAAIYRYEITPEQSKPRLDIGVPELSMTYTPSGTGKQ